MTIITPEILNEYLEIVENKKLLPQNPLITVFIATFNHEKFINNCLDGVLMQKTNFDFDILIKEDNSKDGTRKILLEYQQKHPDKIRLILCKQNLYSKGIKLGGLNLLNAKYKATCEGDDYWTDPLKLQKQIDFLESNPDFIMVYHKWQALWEVNSKSKFGAIKNNPMTLTQVYRTFPDIPNELKKAPNGDTALRFFLSKHGKFKFLDDIRPAIRRIHEGGVMGPHKEIDIIDRRIKTHQVILDYCTEESDKKQSLKTLNKFILTKHILLFRLSKFKLNGLNEFYKGLRFSIQEKELVNYLKLIFRKID